MADRRFPVLDEESPACPRSVPWDFLAPHQAQAHKNHAQSLESLADRGGLCASEMVAVVEDRRWQAMSDDRAVSRLNELLAAWEERHDG